MIVGTYARAHARARARTYTALHTTWPNVLFWNHFRMKRGLRYLDADGSGDFLLLALATLFWRVASSQFSRRLLDPNLRHLLLPLPSFCRHFCRHFAVRQLAKDTQKLNWSTRPPQRLSDAHLLSRLSTSSPPSTRPLASSLTYSRKSACAGTLDSEEVKAARRSSDGQLWPKVIRLAPSVERLLQRS
eukprot:1790358-Pleurochrysis_carterae.AAC.3